MSRVVVPDTEPPANTHTSLCTHADGKGDKDQEKDEIKVLDAGDIQLLKTYGQGPYASQLKRIEKEIDDMRKRVNEKMGVKESETGLAPPNLVRSLLLAPSVAISSEALVGSNASGTGAGAGVS